MSLVINKPYIKNNRLISKIEYDNKEYDLYFEVEKEYTKYLTDDNADCFLITLLPFFVKNNYDVIIKTKISSKLYYQISSYLLPLLCKEFKKKQIKIECELTDKQYNGKGVGASISCGVDSFYTLLKHQNLKDSKYNITHLCFFNAGSNGDFDDDKARKLYKERLVFIKKFCKENKYPLITVDSNMNELIKMNHQCRNTFTTLGCVFALEKLFNKYYFASCFGFNGSHIDSFDTTYYDILNVHCLSNENITFYCSGIETTRIEKLKFISDNPITYNYLNVCVGNKSSNCGVCHKCVRTLTELDSIKKLNLYKNVFNTNYFYNNKSKYYSEIIINNKDRVNHEFYQEIIDECKNNNVKIPIKSYIISFFSFKKRGKLFLKKHLSQKTIDKLKRIKNKSYANNTGWY